MSIYAECPGCREVVKAPEKYSNKNVKCPNCGARILIPHTTSDVVLGVPGMPLRTPPPRRPH